MFKLILMDREGKKLKIGDLVKVSDGRGFSFYAKIQYDKKSKTIAPFHTFSFHSFLKVDKLPKNAIERTDRNFTYWFVHNPESDLDVHQTTTRNYVLSWLECERALKESCYCIELIE